MAAAVRKIPRKRLEELLWLQSDKISELAETVRLLREQNRLLHERNEQLRLANGNRVPPRPYHRQQAGKVR